MSWIPAFTVWQFALAGALAAAGPVVIHLLNRRRYRTVQWAAMDFLREAVQRNRQILQLRDWLLMALRCLAVLFFGLALARPFFSSSAGGLEDRQPLHAIMIVDNSLSMSYETMGGSLLTRAKQHAKQFLEKLPTGSRISVIPACGSIAPYTLDAYASPADASEAIDRIAIVDRSTSMQRVANEAQQASQSLPQLAKRVVFWGDHQAGNWKGLDTPEQFRELPAMQLVNIAPDAVENTWISDLRLEDDLADVETPAKFVVQVRHEGASPRHDVQVSLWVDNAEVGTKTISLEAGNGAREVDFEYLFTSYTPEVGRPLFVPVKATITPDRLALDDERFLIAPVVAALPVVFVDQYGSKENPAANRLGETRHLRKLLAPITSRSEKQLPLIKVRHLSPEQLTRDVLADARIVVMAGITEPSPDHVTLLREFVQQGGQCLLAAGAEFDPQRWNEAAWLEGQGILPFPLKGEPLGQLPERASGELKPFFLSFESLSQNALFHIAGAAEDDLRDTYSEPFFFKAVEMIDSAETLDTLRSSLRKQLTAELPLLAAAHAKEAEFARQEMKRPLTAAEQTERTALQEQVHDLEPNWLLWTASAEFPPESELSSDEALRQRRFEDLVNLGTPQVLGRFVKETGAPFLASRQVGRGRLFFCSTGLLSSWNTLPKTNAIVVFDRLLRDMLAATLPARNFDPRDQLTLPLARFDQDVSVSLLRPHSTQPETLDVGFIGQDQRGVVLHGLVRQGIYQISGRREETAVNTENAPVASTLWKIPLAINSDPVESEPQYLTAGRFTELAAGSPLQWLEEGDEISLAGAAIRGQNLWWYLVLVVFVVLLLEMFTLAWPHLKPAATY